MHRSGFRLATAAVLGFGTAGLGVTTAHAADSILYVSQALGCSDTTTDSSVQPYCHIGAAVAKVVPGQTVQIAAGTYDESVTVTAQGTAAAPVTIKAAPGATVQIGSPAVSQKSGVVFDHAAYTTLSGVKVYGIQSDAAVAVNASSHVGVVGVDAAMGAQSAVHITGSDATLLARSWLADLGGMATDNGVLVDGGSTGTVLAGNATGAVLRAVWIHGATGTAVTGTTASRYACVAGLEVDNSSTGTVAENNILADSDAVLDGTDSNQVCGTDTVDPNHGDIAVAADSVAGAHFDFNLVDNVISQGTNYRWGGQTFTTAADFFSHTGQGARDLVADPKLSTYYVPLEGSPAIDSADSDAAGEQTTDIAGHSRVADPTLTASGTGVRNYDDRGAFEFQDPFSPQATWTATGPFTATITASTTGWHQAAKYTFDFGGGDVVTQDSPTIEHAFVPKPESGTQSYQVSVTATEADTGTKATTPFVVSFFHNPPAPQAVASVRQAPDGKSYSLVVDASGTRAGTEPIASYTFHVVRLATPTRPFDVTVTQSSPVYTLPDALEGTYTIAVSATDTLGVTGSMSFPEDVVATVGPRPAGAVTVERVYGADRYRTAAAVSQKMWADAAGDHSGRKSANAVVLATGEGFADAVAGVPLAAKVGGPLLLTEPKALTAETAAEITRVLPAHQGKTVYLLGGATAVDESVAAKLRSLGYTVVRFGGRDRFATALEIAQQQFASADHVFVATGRDFADALAAGPLAATQNAPIVLSDGPVLDPATAAYVSRHATGAGAAATGPVTAVGGDADRALTAGGGAGTIRHTALAGPDRYATATAVAAAFPQQVDTTHAGIATGEQFADALTGGAMMAELGQPLLLTTRDQLASPDYTALYGWIELRTVTVFGGPAAVSELTVQQIVTQVRGTQA